MNEPSNPKLRYLCRLQDSERRNLESSLAIFGVLSRDIWGLVSRQRTPRCHLPELLGAIFGELRLILGEARHINEGLKLLGRDAVGTTHSYAQGGKLAKFSCKICDI